MFYDARTHTDHESDFENIGSGVLFEKPRSTKAANSILDYHDALVLINEEERKEEEDCDAELPAAEKRKSTLERLHLGFINKLLGRGSYASDEEELKTEKLAAGRDIPSRQRK